MRAALFGEGVVEASDHNWGRVVDRSLGPHIETAEGILVEEEALDFESEVEAAVAAKASRKGAAVLALVASVRPL